MTKTKVKLAITLFKDKVKKFEDCLSDYNIEAVHDIKEQFNLNGKIYIGEQKKALPTWHRFIQSGVNDTISSLENISSRVVILLKIKNRFLGVSFGYGLVLIDRKMIERDFGLKVVINSVDPKNLRSFDSAKLDDNTILTRKQSSRGGNKSVFGTELPSELLCGVSGKCTEIRLGSYVGGKDQLLIYPKVDFTNLGEIVEVALTQFSKTTYKANFSWFDNIRIEQDQGTISSLENNLLDDLTAKKYELFSLASPEIFLTDEIQGFSFTAKGDPQPDLEFDEYISYMSKIPTANYSADYLRSHKIWIKDNNGEDVGKWSIFDCLNYETDLANEKYILFKGDWYHIAPNYLNELQDYFKSKTIFSSLPRCKNKQSEGDYNIQITKSDINLICLDTKNIFIEKNTSAIEPCDILSSSGQFFHIKKKYSSAALSHLFAQGKVSGELLKTNKKFRVKLREKIRKEVKFSDSLIPIDKIDPSKYKITFGVIDEQKGIEFKLPFFSLINFQATGKHLEALGYEVSIMRIIY